MLKPGQTIANPVTGARLLVCETGVESGYTRAIVEHFIAPHSGREAIAHWHTIASERFEILAGSARYQLARVEHAARTGDALDFPSRIEHLHPWNTGDDELHVRQFILLEEPDARYLTVHASFFETLFGLAREGKLNSKGQPNVFQLAVLARSLHPYTYLAGSSVAAQYLFFGSLAWVGRCIGYRAEYPQYQKA